MIAFTGNQIEVALAIAFMVAAIVCVFTIVATWVFDLFERRHRL